MSKINFKISCHHQLSPEVCHQSHRRIFSLLLISLYRKILFYRLSQANMSGFFVKKCILYQNWIFTWNGYLLRSGSFQSKISTSSKKSIFFVPICGFVHENRLFDTQCTDISTERSDLAIRGSLTQRLNLMKQSRISYPL